MSMNTIQIEHHRKHYRNILDNTAYDGFINSDSIWYWMHTVCLEDLDWFFKGIPRSRFLTVGDGYCGREAGFVKRYGHYVHASDVEICLIEMAHGKGLVDEFSAQDMHHLSFADDSFDYVLCKESLHHLPRPYHGLYEMLRVASKGVILIEPNGDFEAKDSGFNGYEECGNFNYSFSSRELIKIGLACGIKNFAYGYSHMFYGMHDAAKIAAGLIEEEKKRLMDVAPEVPPLINFVYMKNKILFSANKFRFVMLDDESNSKPRPGLLRLLRRGETTILTTGS
jgi:SAM-dependent methyltransferase